MHVSPPVHCERYAHRQTDSENWGQYRFVRERVIPVVPVPDQHQQLICQFGSDDGERIRQFENKLSLRCEMPTRSLDSGEQCIWMGDIKHQLGQRHQRGKSRRHDQTAPARQELAIRKYWGNTCYG